jgi:hypothetical protein
MLGHRSAPEGTGIVLISDTENNTVDWDATIGLRKQV